MEAILSIGSNCNNKAENVSSAIERLKKILENCRVSEIYFTESVGKNSGMYANAVLKGDSLIDLESFKKLTKEIEHEFGRTLESKISGIIPIDIDIVYADGVCLRPNDVKFDYFQHGYKAIINS